jgi:hypothetical protein
MNASCDPNRNIYLIVPEFAMPMLAIIILSV